MRKLLLTAALTFVAVAPQRGYAQSDDEMNDDDSGALEGSATVAPSPRRESPASTGRASSPGTQHTVERGDTLWDLSQKYLGSPWYWPKVWSYNPEIANPHWIYPGNEVRFYGAGEEGPTQVEAGKVEAPDLEPGEMVDDGVSVVGDIGYRHKSAMTVASPGFVTSQELEESGQIIGSFSEASILTAPDNMYVRFTKRSPRLGESYEVFRRVGDIIHPITQSVVGTLTEILAEVRVVRVGKDKDKDKTATLQFVKQYGEVRRGDLIGPHNEPILRSVAATSNDREVKDITIVADVLRHPTALGEHSIAIIDRGSEDGVRNGNVVTIFRQHDALPFDSIIRPTRVDDEMPREDVGNCVTFEVKKKASLCLFTRSIREIVRGDKAEIRPSAARRAAR
jgi:hypothetical protein